MKPLVSIVIPVYNGANYMHEAIDSALAQTYPNIEIIVVNDGSTDDGMTEKIALSYGTKIRYFSKENGGVSSALNLGIRQMRGEYFSWLSHDDVYTPDKVEKQMEIMLAASEKNLVILGDYDTIDKDSNAMPAVKRRLPCGTYAPKRALCHMVTQDPHGCAFLIPRAAFDRVGYFDERFRYCQDKLMWWNIFFVGYSLAFSNDVGVHARVHAQQLTQTGQALFHREAESVGQMVIERFAQASDQENPCLYLYAKNEALYRNSENVKRCLAIAKERKLFNVKQVIAVYMLSCYGQIRPLIRRVYYRVFRGISTQ